MPFYWSPNRFSAECEAMAHHCQWNPAALSAAASVYAMAAPTRITRQRSLQVREERRALFDEAFTAIAEELPKIYSQLTKTRVHQQGGDAHIHLSEVRCRAS